MAAELRRLLESEFDVAGVVGDGHALLREAEALAPDAIVTDIVMPRMDGVEALKQIRKDRPQARVVMVSAIDQREKLQECIEAGAIDFIVKPFDKETLTRFLNKMYLHTDEERQGTSS